jgi:hypothetical protein
MSFKAQKKILFLSANPKNTSRLRFDEEAREIRKVLRLDLQQNHFILELRAAMRSNSLQEEIRNAKPQIVHFSGHGKGITIEQKKDFESNVDRRISSKSEASMNQEGLVLEDELGYSKLVSGEALAGLFKLCTAHVECVILNSCFSERQAKAIAQHEAAIEFTRGFYGALASGESIEAAFEWGKNAIHLEGMTEHLTPILLQRMVDTPPATTNHYQSPSLLEFPTGPVPLESPFYIERFFNEGRYYQTILNPGHLLRIIAPALMGKTSLMTRILTYSNQQNCRGVYLNLRDAENEILTDLNSFLYWFCERISAALGLESQLNHHWQSKSFGYIAKCKDYFETYVLSQVDRPFVLGIDELDRLFPHPEIASDFLGMLRNWFERSKDHPAWKQLRLVLAYSTEDYSQFRLNQSPFNVGEPLKLQELNFAQIQDLAHRYGLNWQQTQIDHLMSMLGGHPYLVRLAMYYISHQQITLEQLLQEAPTEDGIYSSHLHRYWKLVQKDPQLAEAVKKVMTANGPVRIERSQAYQLRSMGLVQYTQQGTAILPSCDLYRLYFSR